MVIAFDALPARYGGTAYAVVQIVRALANRPEVQRVLVIARPDSIVARGIDGVPDTTVVLVSTSDRYELAQRLAWQTTRLNAVLERHGVDVLFSAATILPAKPGAALYGLQANPVPYEEPHRIGSIVRRRAIHRTSRWAHATYVPSAHLERLMEDVPRIRVLPLGVDHSRFSPGGHPGNELLCVADFYPHKHHDLILDAYALLPQSRPVLRLIGNTQVQRGTYEEVRRRAARIPGVRVEGRVQLGRLIEAYRNARVFLLASDRESFSMPLIEALACGAAAVVRDHPTLRETGGAAARYVSGGIDAWAREIQLILEDDDLHGQLRDAAVRQARRYSWEAYASTLLANYKADVGP
jgi:glycosyltransferase involved in cell wall biosynthesis